MTYIEPLFVASSALLVVAGLILVGTAVRAYVETDQRVMIHVALGFSLIVAATVATAIGVYMNNFQNTRIILLVNNSFSVCGYLLVFYSVVSYR